MFRRSRTKIISANRKLYPEQWLNVIVDAEGVYDTSTKEYFIIFQTLMSAHNAKVGTRDLDIKYIIYDEFNEGLLKINTRQKDLFDTLMFSMFSPRGGDIDSCKIFIFGNTLSVDVPLLRDLGILFLPKGDLEVRKYGSLILNIYCPKTNDEERAQLAGSKNWLYDFSKMMGTYEKSVIGDVSIDNYKGVVPQEEHHNFKQYTDFNYLKVDEDFFLKLWSNGKEGNDTLFLEYKKNNDGSHYTFTFKSALLEPAIFLRKDLRAEYLTYLEQENVFFDSITSKRGLINLLNI